MMLHRLPPDRKYDVSRSATLVRRAEFAYGAGRFVAILNSQRAVEIYQVEGGLEMFFGYLPETGDAPFRLAAVLALGSRDAWTRPGW